MSWHDAVPTAKVPSTVVASPPQLSVAVSGPLDASVQFAGPASGTVALVDAPPSRPATGPLVAEAAPEPSGLEPVELEEPAAELAPVDPAGALAVPVRGVATAVAPLVAVAVVVVVDVVVVVGVAGGWTRRASPPVAGVVGSRVVVTVVAGCETLVRRAPGGAVPEGGAGDPVPREAPTESTRTIKSSGLDHRTHVEAVTVRRRRVIRVLEG